MHTNFRAAQSVWDNMAPVDHDDDATESELAEATDQFLTDAWATSDWLACSLQQPELTTTHVPANIAEEDVCDLTIDQLWVLMMSGTDKQLIAARFELVSRMTKTCAADIEARVPAIRASNIADAREYLADCYRDDAHHWY